LNEIKERVKQSNLVSQENSDTEAFLYTMEMSKSTATSNCNLKNIENGQSMLLACPSKTDRSKQLTCKYISLLALWRNPQTILLGLLPNSFAVLCVLCSRGGISALTVGLAFFKIRNEEIANDESKIYQAELKGYAILTTKIRFLKQFLKFTQSILYLLSCNIHIIYRP
jgi:hypothetical protein